MTRIVSSSGLSVQLAGIVVNHVAFFAALVAVFRLASRHMSGRAASIAVWVCAFGPLAFVFSMAYPFAIFLAASAGDSCGQSEVRTSRQAWPRARLHLFDPTD